MTTVHQLSRQEARRVAVRAQVLTAERPAGLIDMVQRLTCVQIDPIGAVAPSADLVAWSRLGSAYSPGELRTALAERTLLEHRGMIRPSEDLALYRAEMADWPGRGELRDWQERIRDWVAANDETRREILERLTVSGPLSARDLPDTCAVPWGSSGWTDNKNVTQLLGFMVQRGEVAIAGRSGRSGRDRLWDLASRVYPDDPVVPAEQARHTRNELRLGALGIARARATESPGEPLDVGEVGEPAIIEGVTGEWRVEPDLLGGRFEARTALLSPLDRLVHDRKRMAEIFDFDYQLEMYKPAAARRWGYYALPILHGDRLVGKLDATADRKAGLLVVAAVHEDTPFSRTVSAAVRREIEDLARWLELDLEMPL